MVYSKHIKLTIFYKGRLSMENYGNLLKKLIKFTSVKLSTVADAAGYDVSYISKWCNQSKLPAARVSSPINKSLSKIFADEIISQGELENFCSEFNVVVAEDQLQTYLYTALKDAFKSTQAYLDKKSDKSSDYQTKVLLNLSEIANYFETEFKQMVISCEDTAEILCTLDAVSIAAALDSTGFPNSYDVHIPIHVKIGMSTINLSSENYLSLYFLISAFNFVSFDFYENSSFKDRNIIVLKDRVALMCSLDQKGKISMLSIISDPEKVSLIYSRINSLFKIHHMLIMSMTSDELVSSGYRSNFYAFNDYQIFLARGFEYLLPPEIIDNIVAAAYEQGYDSSTEKMLRTLMVTWEDLFNKETLDFFITKSDLIKYVEDGEFYFTDIVYRMSIEERKKHIEHVLDLCGKNDKINFHIIDDEDMPYSHQYIKFSVYNNTNKLFLKNVDRFYKSYGPQFYSILSEPIINGITECIADIKNTDMCKNYPACSLKPFMEQYGAMVYRMLSLSEITTSK